MSKNRVLIDTPAPHVARVLINRPEAKNAIDHDTRQALIAAVRKALADDSNRALLLGGTEGVFCAGGDLASMRGMTPEQARSRMQNGHELVKLVWNADIPVIAAVEKFAIGAGAGLALLSDYLIVGDTALMSFPFLQFGLVPDWASTQNLVRKSGWGQARRLVLDKARLKGQKLADAGIADLVVADSDVMQTAIDKATAYALYPQLAFRLFKARMQAYPESFTAALRAEEDDQTACFLSNEFEEGLTAFQEKRPADFISVTKGEK